MKKLNLLFILAFAVIVLPACNIINSIRAVKTISACKIGQRNFKEVIPFQNKYGFIVLKVKINGDPQQYEFIFDSGAGTTVLSKEIADKLGLKSNVSITVRDAHGNAAKQEVASVKQMELGSIKFNNVGVVVINYPASSTIRCLGKDGIIGTDILDLCNWTIDFKNSTVTATDSALNFPKGAAVLPFSNKVAFMPYLDVKIGNTMVKNVLVDMGFNGSFTLPERNFNKKSGLFNDRDVYRTIDGSTQGLFGIRQDTAYSFLSDSINLKELSTKKVDISISKYATAKIGNRVWSRYLVGLEYKRNRILLSRQDNKSNFEFNKGFGMTMIMQGDRIFVASLADNSSAADNGIRPGDEVIAINGKPAMEYTSSYCDFNTWYRAYIARETKIVLTINGRPDIITLSSDYYRPFYKD